MQVKFFLFSKTFQGLLVAVILAGYMLVTGGEAEGETSQMISDNVAQALQLLGLVWAGFGRTSATTGIKWWPF